MLSQWNIKLSTLIILSCVVFLMLLIVVLPDVDLPDAAFHRGTGPTAIHAQATSAPAPVTVAAVLRSSGESHKRISPFINQEPSSAPPTPVRARFCFKLFAASRSVPTCSAS